MKFEIKKLLFLCFNLFLKKNIEKFAENRGGWNYVEVEEISTGLNEEEETSKKERDDDNNNNNLI